MSPNRLTRTSYPSYEDHILVGPAFINPSKPEIFIKASSAFEQLSLFQRIALYAPLDAEPVDLYVRTEPLPQSYTETISSGKKWDLKISLPSDNFYFKSPINKIIPASPFKVRIHIKYSQAVETDYSHFYWKDREKTYDFLLDGKNWRFFCLCRLSIIISTVILVITIFLLTIMSVIPITRHSFVWLSTIVITSFFIGILIPSSDFPGTPESTLWLGDIFGILALWAVFGFILSMVIVVLIKKVFSSPLIPENKAGDITHKAGI